MLALAFGSLHSTLNFQEKGNQMKNRTLTLIVVTYVILSCFSQNKVQATSDLRLQPISKAEVKQVIATVPLDSNQHFRVLSRAYVSGIPVTRFAYGQYKILLSKNTDNAQATLLAAAATLKHYEKSSDTQVKGSRADYAPLLKEAGILFRRAMFLNPNSAETNKHYGYYMYRYDYNQGKQIGLVSLQRSANLNPKDVGIHSILGDIYANPYDKTYDPKRAEAELLKAIALDPTYAYPHNRLVGLYLELKKPAKVREHLAAYEKLVPNFDKNNTFVKYVLEACAKMEKAQDVTAVKTKT